MFFSAEQRDAAQMESGTTDPKVISKVLGDKWAQLDDKATYEAQASADRVRFDRENGAYQAALQAEEDEHQRGLAEAAAGPSEREVERAEKRARMEAEAAARADKPKAPKKVKQLSEEEKRLEAQNKAIMGDMDKSAKQRLTFLLGQSGESRKSVIRAPRSIMLPPPSFASPCVPHVPFTPRCVSLDLQICSSISDSKMSLLARRRRRVASPRRRKTTRCLVLPKVPKRVPPSRKKSV